MLKEVGRRSQKAEEEANRLAEEKVDFIVDTSSQIIPVEVKAEINLRAKSLKIYCEKYKPEIAVRTSMADFKKEDWLINLPLYAIDYLPKL